MPQSLCTFSQKKFSECKHVQSLKIDKDVGIILNSKRNSGRQDLFFGISNTRRQIFAGSLSTLVKTINPQNCNIIARSISKDVYM